MVFLRTQATLGADAAWVIDERADYSTRQSQLEKILSVASEKSQGMRIRVIPKAAPPFELVLGEKIGSGAMGSAFFVEKNGADAASAGRQVVKFPRRVDYPGEENEIFSFKQDHRGLGLLQGKGGQKIDPKTSYEETPDLILKTYAEGQEIASALKTPENPGEFGAYTARLNDLRLMLKGWDDSNLKVGDFGLMKNTILTEQGWVVIDPGFVSENNREKSHLRRMEILDHPMQVESYVRSLIASRGGDWLRLHQDLLERVTYGSPPQRLTRAEQTRRWREMLLGAKISGVSDEESRSVRDWVLEIKQTRGTLHPDFRRKPFDPLDPWREEADRWLKDATLEERRNLFRSTPVDSEAAWEKFLGNRDGSFLLSPAERARGLDFYAHWIRKGQGSRIPGHLSALKLPTKGSQSVQTSDLLIELLERHPDLLEDAHLKGFTEAFSPWLKNSHSRSRLKTWANFRRLRLKTVGFLGLPSSKNQHQTPEQVRGFLDCLSAEE